MSVVSSLRARIDPAPATALLAAGDFLAIGLFVLVGEIQHGYHPIEDAVIVTGTLATFLAAWIPVAVLSGLYARDAVRTRRRAVALTFPGWVLAVAVAQALRATEAVRGNAALTFALVSVLFGGAFLVAWRLLATVLVGGSKVR